MDIITTIQITIFIGYVTYIWYRFGVLSSISASTYYLSGVNRWYFFCFLGLIGLLNLHQGLGYWGQYAAIGFICAGLTPDHKANPDTHEDLIHTASTILAIFASFGGLVFVEEVWIHLIAFIVGGTVIYLTALNKIWWVEVWAFACIATGYLAR